MSLILQSFLIGWAVLVGAIVMNAVLNATPWVSWYGYFEAISQKGFSGAHSSVSLLNLLFLYAGYPLVLGLCAQVYRLLI